MSMAEMALPPACYEAEKNLQLINLLNSREQVGEFYKPKW
ncbi:gp009 [Erwinia phage vB_EamP-S6]|uniref:Gp009 n=1 Tax=Erwinia phage vB_EamP-S6 TaxID=1051675 RepID=G0YQA1_9CAUD|nr:gp009 [Erwinia phage vB_EamP-S6]AEJ81528.1 gp009 [Erwinia phage vB_EamP-S6]